MVRIHSNVEKQTKRMTKRMPDTTVKTTKILNKNPSISFMCLLTTTSTTSCHSLVEVCIPELVWNEMRQDEFLNWQDPYKTTSLWSHCSGKSGKNLGNKAFNVILVFYLSTLIHIEG